MQGPGFEPWPPLKIKNVTLPKKDTSLPKKIKSVKIGNG